jgi:hypothetical protein
VSRACGLRRLCTQMRVNQKGGKSHSGEANDRPDDGEGHAETKHGSKCRSRNACGRAAAGYGEMVSLVLATGQAIRDSIWIAVSVIVGVVSFALLSWVFVRLDKRLRRRA